MDQHDRGVLFCGIKPGRLHQQALNFRVQRALRHHQFCAVHVQAGDERVIRVCDLRGWRAYNSDEDVSFKAPRRIRGDGGKEGPVDFRRLRQAGACEDERLPVRCYLKLVVHAAEHLLDFRAAHRGLEDRLSAVLGRNEVKGVAVRSPREARNPLIEAGCQVLDLMRFAIIDSQAKQVGLVAVASLRRVSDVSAVGRVLR